MKLPTHPESLAAKPVILNYAVNNDGDYWPRLSASSTAENTSLNKAVDGHAWYSIRPPNRWTATGSPNANDWMMLEFGVKRTLDTVKLYILDDTKDIVAPDEFTLEHWTGNAWQPVPNQQRTPAKPEGHKPNIIRFAPLAADKIRVTFTHAKNGRTGLTEIEAWGPGTLPNTPAQPPAGNIALNQKGEGFPKASASFHDVFGGVPKSAIDGKTVYLPTPMNRWTSYGSPNETDWLEVDFGSPKEAGRVDLAIYDDRGGVQPPTSYTVQYFGGAEWKDAANQTRTPTVPTGSTLNTVRFDKVTASKVRILFVNKGKARSGVTEIEIWRE